MAIICGICTNSINTRRDNGVSCSVCKKQFHSICICESIEFFELLNKIKGLSWKCDECIINCVTVNENDISKLIEENVVRALSTLNNTVNCLKSDILKLSDDRKHHLTSNVTSGIVCTPKYSDILKNKTNPAVIIQPKNQSQHPSQTKADLLEKVNPANASIHLSKVVNVKNGGVLISCINNNENETFKKMVQDNLSESYIIKEVHGIQPRVRIVGFRENYTAEKLHECIVNCNSNIFESSICKVIKVFPTKKNKDIFQAVLQLDKVTYQRVINVGHLFVNYDSCVIFEAIEVGRCYKCNELHHSAKYCVNPVSCPRCGQNHEVKTCKSETLSCSNCVKHNRRHNLNVTVNHAAWDTSSCTVYKQACDKAKADFLTGPGQ